MANVSKRIPSSMRAPSPPTIKGHGLDITRSGTDRPDSDSDPGHVVVVGQWRKGHARLPVPYARAVEQAGGTAKIFSAFNLVPNEVLPEGLEVQTGIDPDDASPLDGAVGLVLPSGGDIDPTWYGRRPHPQTKNVSHVRDRFELTLLNRALDENIPVLAICHGMQLLNVQMGGTLDQHLADTPDRLDHDAGSPVPTAVHDVRIEPGSVLEEVFGRQRLGVNSSHHQGLDDVAAPLEEIAWADDGVLEAVVSREHPWVVGVQWHPEAMAFDDECEMKLFEAFVAATRDYASGTVTAAAR